MASSTLVTVTLVCVQATKKYPDGRTGTPAGYDAHKRRGERPCRPCTDAWSAKSVARGRALSGAALAARRAQSAEAARKYREREPDRAAAAKHRFIEGSREIIRTAKARSCADCGVQYPHYVMQFDHLDGAQKNFTIGWRGPTLSRTRLLAEIAKCEIVCANCHAIRTHERRIAAGRKPDDD